MNRHLLRSGWFFYCCRKRVDCPKHSFSRLGVLDMTRVFSAALLVALTIGFVGCNEIEAVELNSPYCQKW